MQLRDKNDILTCGILFSLICYHSVDHLILYNKKKYHLSGSLHFRQNWTENYPLYRGYNWRPADSSCDKDDCKFNEIEIQQFTCKLESYTPNNCRLIPSHLLTRKNHHPQLKIVSQEASGGRVKINYSYSATLHIMPSTSCLKNCCQSSLTLYSPADLQKITKLIMTLNVHVSRALTWG